MEDFIVLCNNKFASFDIIIRQCKHDLLYLEILQNNQTVFDNFCYPYVTDHHELIEHAQYIITEMLNCKSVDDVVSFIQYNCIDFECGDRNCAAMKSVINFYIQTLKNTDNGND
jgi:hypothetical protein